MTQNDNYIRIISLCIVSYAAGKYISSTMQRNIAGPSETLALIHQTKWCHIPEIVNPLLTVMKTKISFRQEKFQQNTIHRYGNSFSQYSKC